MDDIRKRNAKELNGALEKFIKEQKRKYGHKTTIRDAEKRHQALDWSTTAHCTGLL